MTDVITPGTDPGPSPDDDAALERIGEAVDRITVRSWSLSDYVEVLGAALSSLCLTWLIYEVLAKASGGLGFAVSWFVVFLAMYYLLQRQRLGKLAARDRMVASIITAFAVILVGSLVIILGYVVVKGIRTLRFTFFTNDLRHTGPLSSATAGGGLAAIVGTIEQVGLAMLMSVPLGIATAVFLSEVRGSLGRPVRIFVEGMNGIPSILAGLFIYAMLIPKVIPQSGFAVSLALTISMLPTVTRACEVVFRLVPGGLREASLALGGHEWRMASRVILPTARVGIVTAIILGIARVVGETAPGIIDTHSSNAVNWNPFSGPQDNLPLFIYRLIREPIKAENLRAWTGGLVLIAIILVLFALARVLGRQGVKK